MVILGQGVGYVAASKDPPDGLEFAIVTGVANSSHSGAKAILFALTEGGDSAVETKGVYQKLKVSSAGGVINVVDSFVKKEASVNVVNTSKNISAPIDEKQIRHCLWLVQSRA